MIRRRLARLLIRLAGWIAQPAPTLTTGPAIWDLVQADIAALPAPNRTTRLAREALAAAGRDRDAIGLARYGTRLQAHNGRDALRDAFDEDLDGLAYTRDALERAPTPRLRAIYATKLRTALAMAREVIR